MMDQISIHICDWNMKDRVISVSRERAAGILLDTTRPASERMDELYELALEEGAVSRDPRTSEIENADIFLPWPDEDGGFISNANWDRELAKELTFLRD